MILLKELMSELYDSVDYNNVNFEYVGPTKNVSFYEYRHSNELFNVIKDSQIKFSEVRNKLKEFLSKLNEVKIGKKTPEQKEIINNLEIFYKSKEEVTNFLTTMLKCYLIQIKTQMLMLQSKCFKGCL